ncbi:uncharacterized protein SPSK_01129 [Sporothrix schenckii 1099-18]|uniref:LysM domain-containing protein n=2 Tax=Sporothrix schenckii TaxID=29908 RepID=U7PP57_SPOS1|nr:uncharacterized protein SPSK_01129 [Sporothrix schenckii 1099-18]ERS96514.1 hypothetical protein HMPREF1624_06718 [Sporothrix schenckii ATCC 58251]KJR81179.1 hypothetical protein SPSK_01129 [Sporothrix schenckii 1099-18]
MGRFSSFLAAVLLAVAPALTIAVAVSPAAAEVTAPFVGHQITARTVNCEFRVTADDNATCIEFTREWGLTVDQFMVLNPTVTCPMLTPDTPYCVLGTVSGPSTSGTVGPIRSPTSVSYTLPTGTGGPSSVDISFSTYPTTTSKTTTTKTSTTSSSTSSMTGSKPAPTQAGLAANCNNFHLVVKGDSCSKIESSYGVSAADFLTWNPALQSNCLGLLTGYYVCVGVPGGTTAVQPSSLPISTTSKATTSSTIVTSRTTSSTSKTSTASTVLPISTTSKATTSSTIVKSKTTSSTSKTSTASTVPSPLQPGTFDNCTAYHLVVAGDSCSAIETAAGISSAQFATWNSGVNADCTNIDVGYYLCVGGGGGVVSAIPSPLQPGTFDNCTAYHLVVAGDSCSAVETAAGISSAQFATWNSGVNADCTNIQVGHYLCIAGGGGAVSSTPSPLQPGTISTCTKYHLVASGDTCASIEAAAGITAAQWAKWNPSVNSACTNIDLGYYVCVGA